MSRPCFFRPMDRTVKLRRCTIVLLACAVLVLSAAVYLPGIPGPYVFDDRYNILSNSYLKIGSLDRRELYQASFSIKSGPLLRPVSMLSFALNHYFAGSFNDSRPLKATNLAIHVINGLLVFWLMRLLLARATRAGSAGGVTTFASASPIRTDLLAAAVALLWLVHPINLTSVLYVVQRMTSLSALFTLLGLTLYLKGRSEIAAGRYSAAWLIVLGLVGCGGLGVLSKENAALLPLFMLAIELTLFADEEPWRAWSRLSPRTKGVILTVLFILVAAALIGVISFAAGRYGSRPFTMTERVLTEARVLMLYLSLLLVPRIDLFGLYHDDIAISTSLLSPWTTLASVLGIVALVGLALSTRRRLPLLSLGIAWFFVGHLLESTVIPLEIAHEHRNYLAAMGIILAVVHVLDRCSLRPGAKRLWVLYPMLALMLGGITLLRASQWSDLYTLAHYEVRHHPDSARAQALFASAAYVAKDYEGALRASQRASTLEPNEPGYRINGQIASVQLGVGPDATEHAEIIELLSSKPPSIVTQMTLQYVTSCIPKACAQLREQLEMWLRTVIEKAPAKADRSFYYYLLGRALLARGETLEALNALERSHQLDSKYLHPLFLLAAVFVELGHVNNAALMLERIRDANTRTPHPRHKEIAELAAIIEGLKSGHAPSVNGENLRDRLAPASDLAVDIKP